MNWRLLEAEIVDIARQGSYEVDEDINNDKVLVIRSSPAAINLTEFARELAEKVELKVKPVRVKSS